MIFLSESSKRIGGTGRASNFAFLLDVAMLEKVSSGQENLENLTPCPHIGKILRVTIDARAV